MWTTASDSLQTIKRRVQAVFQRMLGWKAYLFVFGLYTMADWRRKEPAFFRFLGQIPDEGVILDIGANLGVTAVYMARKCPNATVMAFEPVAWNVENIKRMARLFRLRNLSIQNCAAGDQTGDVDFVVPTIHGARMHALGHVGNSTEGEQFTVSCYKLDDLALNNVTAIKIDVENSEHKVLAGGLQLLRRCRPLIYCELWDNENRRESMELLGSLGYVPFSFEGGRLLPFRQGSHREQNFIFVSES